MVAGAAPILSDGRLVWAREREAAQGGEPPGPRAWGVRPGALTLALGFASGKGPGGGAGQAAGGSRLLWTSLQTHCGRGSLLPRHCQLVSSGGAPVRAPRSVSSGGAPVRVSPWSVSVRAPVCVPRRLVHSRLHERLLAKRPLDPRA